MDASEVTRLFSMEGAVHLYSSPPCALSPADLYDRRADLAQALSDCHLYCITRRPRMHLDPRSLVLHGRRLTGHWWTTSPQGPVAHVFECELGPALIGGPAPPISVSVTGPGTHLLVTTAAHRQRIANHVLVAASSHTLPEACTDLEVLYVGQGIGQKHARSAVDRLRAHTTFQRILADFSSHHPDQELLLLLYRFEHQRMLISTGGVLAATPAASAAEDAAHLDRLINMQLGLRETITLAEAGLINHFKPAYNVLLKSSNFSARRKLSILQRLLDSGVAGLIVELTSHNLGSRVVTPHASPLDLATLLPDQVRDGDALSDDAERAQWRSQQYQMRHTHFAPFALTTADERDSFLHGTLWHGESERASLLP